LEENKIILLVIVKEATSERGSVVMRIDRSTNGNGIHMNMNLSNVVELNAR